MFQRSPMPRATPLVALIGIGLLAVAAPASAAVDLIGTWFVVIHYKDSMTANPDADRWEDKVWKIEKKGSRLKWTEYPIVVFNDGSGRFGRVGGNPRARLLVKWEPNAAQTEEIQQGLQVNSRGSKTKTLRGGPKRGYRSTSRSRSASAMTVGYQETWSIENPTTLPVFTRDDALGAESALATKSGDIVSGRTRYATFEVSEDGNLLTGEYSRDENKRGTFKLIRAGSPRGLESDGRTPNERQRDRIQEQIRQGIQTAAYGEFLRELGDENTRRLRAQIGEEALSNIFAQYENRLIAGDPRARVEIGDALRAAYAKSVLDEIQTKLIDGDPDALWAAQQKGVEIPPDKLALIRSVRETVGEEKLAALREKYGDDVKAGDESAKRALRTAIRDAYEESLKEEFMDRLQAGDPEAMRQMREYRRNQQDRR